MTVPTVSNPQHNIIIIIMQYSVDVILISLIPSEADIRHLRRILHLYAQLPGPTRILHVKETLFLFPFLRPCSKFRTLLKFKTYSLYT
jgi:hypothetical protein